MTPATTPWPREMHDISAEDEDAVRPLAHPHSRAPHGSETRYRAGCRCSECRDAHARYSAERRAIYRERKAAAGHPVRAWTRRAELPSEAMVRLVCEAAQADAARRCWVRGRVRGCAGVLECDVDKTTGLAIEVCPCCGASRPIPRQWPGGARTLPTIITEAAQMDYRNSDVA